MIMTWYYLDMISQTFKRMSEIIDLINFLLDFFFY